MGKIISVIGPPACGKTLLCRKLAEKTNWAIIEEFDYMPEEVIEELNNDPYSLRTQIWFRNRRIETMLKAKQLSRNNNVILDTCFLTSEVHIDEMTNNFEKELATEMNEQDIKLLGFPDVLIGIMCSEEQMYRFFKIRNATYEQSESSFKHHCQVRKKYLELYKKYSQIIRIPTEGMEFNNSEDLNIILQIIRKNIEKRNKTNEDFER